MQLLITLRTDIHAQHPVYQ